VREMKPVWWFTVVWLMRRTDRWERVELQFSQVFLCRHVGRANLRWNGRAVLYTLALSHCVCGCDLSSCTCINVCVWLWSELVC
jgi:hypothetical protein